MAPDIKNRDLILLERREVKNRDIVFALVNGARTLKRLIIENDARYLRSDDGKIEYPVTPQVEIVGVVVQVERAGPLIPIRGIANCTF